MAKKKIKIYLDTSVISANFDKKNPERQALTRHFLERKIITFKTFVSEVVLAEIERTRNERLRDELRNLAFSFHALSIDIESEKLAETYIRYGAIPPAYREDSLHIAVASINSINYLLSWNFDHIVKVKTKAIVKMVNTLEGYSQLEIITPAELL